VISHITAKFRKAFQQLPTHVQEQAREAYRLFAEEPAHPSLEFKHLRSNREIYSVRVGLGYRALAVRDGEALIWFWIGSYADYDHLIHLF
jgi:mRNA-degrading endonuclease RelE of RelBE toxin-antitoxin system